MGLPDLPDPRVLHTDLQDLHIDHQVHLTDLLIRIIRAVLIIPVQEAMLHAAGADVRESSAYCCYFR